MRGSPHGRRVASAAPRRGLSPQRTGGARSSRPRLPSHTPAEGRTQNRIRFTNFRPLHGLSAALYYYQQQHLHTPAEGVYLPHQQEIYRVFFLKVIKPPSNCLMSQGKQLNNLGPKVIKDLSLFDPSPDLMSGGSKHLFPSLVPTP